MTQSLRGLGSVVAVVLAAAALAAGCGTSTASTTPGDGSPSERPSGSVASVDVPGSLPAVTPDVVQPSSPAPSDSPSPSDVPTAPAASSPATACSGTAENRDFFATVAGLVSWDVYCAVVPAGWYIDSGRWRLKDGGRLDVTYHGPNGAQLVLAEGVFCTDSANACSPHDQVLGDASFADRSGQLVSVGGGFGVYVDPGQRPSWQATATGLDQATFVRLVAAVFRVAR